VRGDADSLPPRRRNEPPNPEALLHERHGDVGGMNDLSRDGAHQETA
jgi:hypothetical protein